MFRALVLCFLVFSFFKLNAQVQFNQQKTTKIVYQTSYHDEVLEGQDPIWVLSDGENVLISSENKWNQKSNYPFEMSFIKTQNKNYIQMAFLDENETIGMWDENSIEKQEFEITDETKKILGYNCKKAKTVINSNTIELWFTDELKIKGSPIILGQDLGLVLEFVRNGNYAITAIDLKKQEMKIPEYLQNAKIEELAKLDYQDRIWRSRFTSISVFDKQQIHFSEEFEEREGVERFANGTLVLKKVKFPKLNTDNQIFIELIEQSNGDAYDRTGSVFMIPMDKKQSFLDGLRNGADTLPIYDNGNGKKYQGIVRTENYTPLVELMRFFTPFGVDHFNDRVELKGKEWHNWVPYRQEVSQFASLFSEQEVYIGVFIGNYDKGGHTISMDISIHNEGKSDEVLQKVVPLFNSLNVMEMAGQEYSTLFNSEKGLEVEFELKEPLKNTQLRYITTGHGGWGNGDEFVQKKNTINLDGKVIFDLIPWKEDCGSYRLFNPVSGNFANGLSSSDLSRSNWCPATVTNPYIIDLGDLSAGKHKIQVVIPQGEPEGNSFSAWNVSGVLIGE